MSKRQSPPEKPAPTKLQLVDDQHPFRHLRSMPNTFDVVFVVGEERFEAHRNVVATASPHFIKLLYNGTKEPGEEEVLLPKFSPRTLRAALDFIYGEQVDLSTLPIDDVLKLVECAKSYQKEKMQRAVLNWLESSMNESNFRERLNIAMRKNALLWTVLVYVDKDFARLCDLNSFAGIDVNIMVNFIGYWSNISI